MRYILILAGGNGTRLWPLSRRESPKHVCPLLDAETMLQKTYRRVRNRYPASAVVVATVAAHALLVRTQLPELPARQLIVEPEGRDTAAALAYAARTLLHRDYDAILTTVNSDAYVRDDAPCFMAIGAAQEAAERSDAPVVLIGLQPEYPETGYGYIEVAEHPSSHDRAVPVVRFVEKPDAETASQYLAGGKHLWNPALFTFRARTFLDLVRTHLPAHARALDNLSLHATGEEVAAAFRAMPRISVDYGILERTRGLLVIPAQFHWADIGSWRSVHETLADPVNTNVVHGKHVGIESNGNLIVSSGEKLVATVGLSDTVVIDTPDALLVCPRDRAQSVKEIVRELERIGCSSYL